ncbi:MAG: RNA 2',3'-cyclic phosphodiesterase [Chloroflexi bacterium]|nr:RNA 2',3'-cyclic phosphodiesterase [Chloroflexota bacterium]MCL5275302.1 RNA 2',3'-cyclic phosphodiesterase [Chloroflexota bacterium]
MAELRVFIAIELDDAIKAALAKAQQRLRAEPISGFVRWVDPAGLHLTMKFLGDIDSQRVPHVLGAMQAACASTAPFELAVRGAGCFPNYQRPNVIWAGIVGDVKAATALAQRLEDECARLGFDPEERPFSPHFTLGRVKREAGLKERGQLGEMVRRFDLGPVGAINADTVHLMRSELRPSGALYTSLGRVKLE